MFSGIVQYLGTIVRRETVANGGVTLAFVAKASSASGPSPKTRSQSMASVSLQPKLRVTSLRLT